MITNYPYPYLIQQNVEAYHNKTTNINMHIQLDNNCDKFSGKAKRTTGMIVLRIKRTCTITYSCCFKVFSALLAFSIITITLEYALHHYQYWINIKK